MKTVKSNEKINNSKKHYAKDIFKDLDKNKIYKIDIYKEYKALISNIKQI